MDPLTYLPLMFLFKCLSDPLLSLIPDASDLSEHLFSPGVVSALGKGDSGLI